MKSIYCPKSNALISSFFILVCQHKGTTLVPPDGFEVAYLNGYCSNITRSLSYGCEFASGTRIGGLKPVIYHLSYIYETVFYFPGFVGSFLQWVIDKSCISLVHAMTDYK